MFWHSTNLNERVSMNFNL